MNAVNSNRSYAFSLFWMGLTTFVFLAAVGIVRPDNEIMLVPVVIHCFIVLVILGTLTKPVGIILVLGLCLRMVFLYADINTNLPVFGSGQDTENFYKVALQIYSQPNLIGEDLYGGVFPQLVGTLFWVIGPQRMLVQYLNVLLGVATLILIGMAGNKLGAKPKNISIVLGVCALMPISASISAIFLRESLITFLVSVSVYWFCCWFRKPSFRLAIGAMAAVAIAGIFHLGVFGILFGYVIAFFLYDSESGKFVWTFQRLASMLPILAGFLFVVVSFSELFLEKLETVSTAGDVVSKATNSGGGSAYLPGIEINSSVEFSLFGGVKALLLLISPPPWLWRSVYDVASFTLDGVVFLVALIVLIKGLKSLPPGRAKKLVILLFLSILATALIIGAGTSNSGTAMRHRQKIVPLMAVAVIFAMPGRRTKWDGAKKELEKPLPDRRDSTQGRTRSN